MPFLLLRQTRRLDVTLEYMIGRWSWCPPMRLPTKNKKIVQKFRKLDISQLLFNQAINFLYVEISLSLFQVCDNRPYRNITCDHPATWFGQMRCIS
jgi:hypothetical protein